VTWFFAVLIVLVIGATAVVASGVGDPMAEEYDDRPDVRVQADGPLTAADLRGVRFTTALRGYRASEVDALLARLARELDVRPVTGPVEPVAPDSSVPSVPPVDADWRPPVDAQQPPPQDLEKG
jgi:DivIVA domain-containing protein